MQNNILFKGRTSSFFVQLLRYIFSGGVAFVVDKTLFLVFRYGMEWDKYLATSIGFLVGLVITYLLSIMWIFDQRRIKRTSIEILIFSAIGLTGLLLMNLFMWLFSDIMNVRIDFISNLLSTVLVTLWNFIAKKYILFTKPNQND